MHALTHRALYTWQ